MELQVDYLDGVRFAASTRGHVVICDQPAADGGPGQGMTPPEFLLASLGACAGYYAAEYLRTRSLPADGLRVRVKAEKLLQPARLDQFEIEVEVPAMEEPRHREGILRAVKRCLIHNTLLHAPAVEVRLAEAVTMG